MAELKSFALRDIPHRIHGRTGTPDITGTEDIALFWHGSALEVKVSASELWVDVSVDFEIHEPWVLIEINGALIGRQMLQRGGQKVCLFRNFDPTLVHTVKFIKDTQAMNDDDEKIHSLVVRGIEASDAKFFPVDEHPYKFEFIGDSITSGEGLRGAHEEMQWITAWMSTINQYGVATARHFNAEYRFVSQGGWGIISGWDGDLRHTIPSVYKKICGVTHGERNVKMGSQHDYDFASWQPDAVIINLGTNDSTAFSTGVAKVTRAQFVDAAVDFLKTVRENNPKAYIVWIYGMCEVGLTREIGNAVSRYIAETGDERIAYQTAVTMTEQSFGSRQHPGPLIHEKAANQLISFLSQVL
ncbi:MAG: SGNH/GDSL hydrolase family protein [Treponema sp.]|nr:SGNH/GDSL hydrolase family protein [Candidatus Treponema caballi]